MCVGPEVIALTQLAITIAATAQQQEAQRQQISDANKIAQENARLADESYKNQLAQIAQKNKTIRQPEQKEIKNIVSKTRRKRQSLSVSATKSINKHNVQITVSFE